MATVSPSATVESVHAWIRQFADNVSAASDSDLEAWASGATLQGAPVYMDDDGTTKTETDFPPHGPCDDLLYYHPDSPPRPWRATELYGTKSDDPRWSFQVDLVPRVAERNSGRALLQLRVTADDAVHFLRQVRTSDYDSAQQPADAVLVEQVRQVFRDLELGEPKPPSWTFQHASGHAD